MQADAGHRARHRKQAFARDRNRDAKADKRNAGQLLKIKFENVLFTFDDRTGQS